MYLGQENLAAPIPLQVLATADFPRNLVDRLGPGHLAVELSRSPSALTVGRWCGSSALLVVQCQHHPLTWFIPPAEAVYRGVALGAIT